MEARTSLCQHGMWLQCTGPQATCSSVVLASHGPLDRNRKP